MAAPPAMTSNHARSPVIKVIAGEDEIFGEEDPDVALNVFHVSKSLLLENSNALTKSSSSEPLKFGDVQRYFKFADLVGSEKLRNTIMDSMQDVPMDHWDLDSLLVLDSEYSSSLASLWDFVLECLAYKIVVGGWAEFTGPERDHEGSVWGAFVSKTDNIALLNRLLLKVDQLHEEKDHHRLVAPTARKDCKWHEHASDDTKAKCPRNATAPWKAMVAYKDLVNGHGTVVETNGFGRAESLFGATT
ncbi:hypothetical protein CLAIMM_10565 [Cladophialophora immunda]|nr:hypothetical protein CLAIMM_10565 [Cladophialophora immunda]